MLKKQKPTRQWDFTKQNCTQIFTHPNSQHIVENETQKIKPFLSLNCKRKQLKLLLQRNKKKQHNDILKANNYVF